MKYDTLKQNILIIRREEGREGGREGSRGEGQLK